MREDGAERVLEQEEEEREEEDDVLFQTDTSASSIASVGSEGRDVVDDPALDVGGKVDGANNQQVHPPPRRRSSSRKPSGSFVELQDDRRERRRRTDSSVPPGSPSNSGWLGIDLSLIIAPCFSHW